MADSILINTPPSYAGGRKRNIGSISEADMMSDLANTKIALAEMEGNLTAARRDCARVREELAAAKGDAGSLAEERDKAWEEVWHALVLVLALELEHVLVLVLAFVFVFLQRLFVVRGTCI